MAKLGEPWKEVSHHVVIENLLSTVFLGLGQYYWSGVTHGEGSWASVWSDGTCDQNSPQQAPLPGSLHFHIMSRISSDRYPGSAGICIRSSINTLV